MDRLPHRVEKKRFARVAEEAERALAGHPGVLSHEVVLDPTSGALRVHVAAARRGTLDLPVLIAGVPVVAARSHGPGTRGPHFHGGHGGSAGSHTPGGFASLGDQGSVAVLRSTGAWPQEDDQVGAALQAASRAFYENHRDDFDFLVLTSDAELPCGCGGVYYPIRNDVLGLAPPGRADGRRFDRSSAWGSGGALRGVVYLPRQDDIVLLQEIGHCWGSFAWVQDRDGESISNVLLRWYAGDDGHWNSFLLDGHSPMDYDDGDLGLDAGAGYTSIDWEPVGDGLYWAHTVRSGEVYYSDLDLYLMGLADPTEVGDITVLLDARRMGTSGRLFQARPYTFDIDAVVAANGRRDPAGTGSATYRVAAIHLTPDASADAAGLALAERTRRRLARLFYQATRFRGQIDATLAGSTAPRILDTQLVGAGAGVRLSWRTSEDCVSWVRLATTAESILRTGAEHRADLVKLTSGSRSAAHAVRFVPGSRRYGEIWAEAVATGRVTRVPFVV